MLEPQEIVTASRMQDMVHIRKKPKYSMAMFFTLYLCLRLGLSESRALKVKFERIRNNLFGHEIGVVLTGLHHILHAQSCNHFPWFPHTPKPPQASQTTYTLQFTFCVLGMFTLLAYFQIPFGLWLHVPCRGHSLQRPFEHLYDDVHLRILTNTYGLRSSSLASSSGGAAPAHWCRFPCAAESRRYILHGPCNPSPNGLYKASQKSKSRKNAKKELLLGRFRGIGGLGGMRDTQEIVTASRVQDMVHIRRKYKHVVTMFVTFKLRLLLGLSESKALKIKVKLIRNNLFGHEIGVVLTGSHRILHAQSCNHFPWFPHTPN